MDLAGKAGGPLSLLPTSLLRDSLTVTGCLLSVWRRGMASLHVS